MSIYLCRALYSTHGFKGMLDKPNDREAAAKAVFEAAGAKCLQWFATVNDGGFVLICDATAEQLTSIRIATQATGFVDEVVYTELIDTHQQQASMLTAQDIAKKFTAPGK
jgi:uncharacterized protein with GYD domain